MARARAFLTSDLSRRRKEVLAAARTGVVVIRDTDGALFTIAPADDLAAAATIAEVHRTLRALVASARVERPDASALGGAAWAADWPPERRWTLIQDLIEALALAESLNDPTPAVGLLEASRPRPRLQGPPFDAAAAFDALSDEDRALLRGRRRTARR